MTKVFINNRAQKELEKKIGKAMLLLQKRFKYSLQKDFQTLKILVSCQMPKSSKVVIINTAGDLGIIG